MFLNMKVALHFFNTFKKEIIPPSDKTQHKLKLFLNPYEVIIKFNKTECSSKCITQLKCNKLYHKSIIMSGRSKGIKHIYEHLRPINYLLIG